MITITITNSYGIYNSFLTIYSCNNTFIVKDITLIHIMSLACNYLMSFIGTLLPTPYRFITFMSNICHFIHTVREKIKEQPKLISNESKILY